MKSITIESSDIKAFMNHLLIKDTFDSFLLEEAAITTSNSFTIDGHIHKDFYSEEEYDTLPDKEFLSWSKARPFCFDIIKGNKLPLQFKIVIKASKTYTEKLLLRKPCSIAPENVGGLYINIRYDSASSLTIVSMASLNIFTMDKSLEEIWDNVCTKFINNL